jgi:hypothetical protein
LAADATALPAVFAPLTVASLAVSIVLLLLGDFRVLCLEDAVRRAVARDWLPFDDGRVRERDFVVVAPFDRDLRALVRFPFELRLALLFVCWAITQILSLAPEPANYPRGRTAIRKLRIVLPTQISATRARTFGALRGSRSCPPRRSPPRDTPQWRSPFRLSRFGRKAAIRFAWKARMSTTIRGHGHLPLPGRAADSGRPAVVSHARERIDPDHRARSSHPARWQAPSVSRRPISDGSGEGAGSCEGRCAQRSLRAGSRRAETSACSRPRPLWRSPPVDGVSGLGLRCLNGQEIAPCQGGAPLGRLEGHHRDRLADERLGAFMGAARNVFPEWARRDRIVDSLHNWWRETKGRTFAPPRPAGRSPSKKYRSRLRNRRRKS